MKQKKRGRGRPKKGPIDLAAARAVVAQTLRKRQAERDAEAALALPTAAEVIEEASLVTRKHRYTKEEMEDLRKKLDYVYQKYVEESWEAEAKANRELNKRLHEVALKNPRPVSTAKLMTQEEWNFAHGLRADGSKRRGPAPKVKKKIWDLAQGEHGTAEHPSEPVDLDAMEAAFEAQLFERHIQEQRNQPQMVKGKRFRMTVSDRRKPPQPKNFWY